VLDPIADAVTELGSACGELFLINTSRATAPLPHAGGGIMADRPQSGL